MSTPLRTKEEMEAERKELPEQQEPTTPKTDPEGVDDKDDVTDEFPDKDSVAAEVAAAEAAADEDEDDESGLTPEQLEDKREQEEEARRRKREEDMDALEDLTAQRTWVIGKPPELGGKENQFSVYTQKPLGYFQMMRFMSLTANTISEAVKAGGTVQLEDLWGEEGLTWRERGQRLRSQDFSDAGSFIAMAFKLIAYSPDFLLDCYCLWLDVPAGTEREWAKRVMARPWDPANGQYGLKEDDGDEIVQTFIDQNYEDIRTFFVEKLPKWVLRLSKQERDRKRKQQEQPTSASSKPSKQFPLEEATR
jgi:hypothetical protein